MSAALSAILASPADAGPRATWRPRREARPTLRAVARGRVERAANPASAASAAPAASAASAAPAAQQAAAAWLDAGPATRPDPMQLEALALGREYARHGLALPADLACGGLDDAGHEALRAGWRRGRVLFAGRSAAATPQRRDWLALRLQAWRAGIGFEPLSLTPAVLARLQASHCPVTREALAPADGSAAGGAVPAAIARLDPARGVEAGHLLRLSQRAARWLDPALAGAPDAAPDAEPSAAAAARLAALQALVQPMPHLQAARAPLRVLPPARLRVAAPVRMLQALLSRLLLRSGWSPRLAAWGALLPTPAQREALQHFFPALLARVLAAGHPADAMQRRWAIEDAWADAEVQRLWWDFARQLDAAGIERLIERAARQGLCEPLLLHPDEACAAEPPVVQARPVLPRQVPMPARPGPAAGPEQLCLPWSTAR